MYKIERKPLSFWERLYVITIAKGMLITWRHLFRNLLHPKKMPTYHYPEQKKEVLPSYRAEHRLMLRPDNTVRCTACMLCATVCPAKCISIEAQEDPDPTVEKRAKSYTIDLLRCVFCGFCVEACPCDAVRMDTMKVNNAGFKREDFLLDIRYLASNHPPSVSPYSTALET